MPVLSRDKEEKHVRDHKAGMSTRSKGEGLALLEIVRKGGDVSYPVASSPVRWVVAYNDRHRAKEERAVIS